MNNQIRGNNACKNCCKEFANDCFNTLYDYYNHIVIQVMNGISPVKNFYSAVFYPDHDEYGYTAVAKNNGDGTFEDVKTELGVKLIETNLD